MNYKEVREVNDLIDEIKSFDRLIIDAQSPVRTLKVSTNFNGVTLMNAHKIKIMQVLLEIRGELARKLEELGVTEE